MVKQKGLLIIKKYLYINLQIGFEKYAEQFAKNMVDGDMLLLITEEELKKDIQIGSGLLRKRFMRELESLKVGDC